MLIKADKNKFIKIFNPETGFYARTSELKVDEFKWGETAEEITEAAGLHAMKVADQFLGTGNDPFMADYPELLDIGVMGW